jgi:hypothetical protein
MHLLTWSSIPDNLLAAGVVTMDPSSGWIGLAIALVVELLNLRIKKKKSHLPTLAETTT